jgi:DNA-binding LytR/AlgR family response regulator
MKIVVVEDERPAARMVIDMLARVAPSATVVAQHASITGLVSWLAAEPAPDLILADIELEDGRVFEAFRDPSVATPPTIFMTAYDCFMLDAFRAHGIAYLLKPLRDGDLAAALAKYEDLRRAFAGASPLARLPAQIAPTPAYRRHVTVTIARKIYVIQLERVALLRIALTGVELVGVDGVVMSATGNPTLAELEATLPPTQYFRINRAEIVRLDAIAHIEPRKDRLWLAVKGVSELRSVSVHRTAAFRRWLDLR